MINHKNFTFFLLGIICYVLVDCKSPKTILTKADSKIQQSNTPEKDTTMKSLMVYGDDFMFGVREPDGWQGNIDNAKQYKANIIFYKSKKDFDKRGALIQVSNFNKQDENTERDLESDIKSYKDEYKDLKEKNFIVSHKEYKCYSKIVYVENVFFQYIVYVNPGAKYKSGLSVAMNISKRDATKDELKAFRKIIASLMMLKG